MQSRIPNGLIVLIGTTAIAGMVISCVTFSRADLTATALVNQAAYIPPQCYTKTVGDSGRVYNTCYPCHTRGLRPDFINDADLQLEYSLPSYAETNRWSNLFEDRKGRIKTISDAAALGYVRKSNYLDRDGSIIPARTLRNVPEAWDYNGDGVWSGYVPDCRFAFDEQGFDRDPTGGYTGWRAYAFYPFPGLYWPTNGSWGDVCIRLPEVFRNLEGRFNLQVYTVNLAILESVIKQHDVIIDPADEQALGADLDKDGRIGVAQHIAFDWAPTEGRNMSWAGDAGKQQGNGKLSLAAGLFPEGTEFLHTLRYLDVDEKGLVRMAPRMKELRYARKTKRLTYAELETLAMNAIKERNDFPDRLELPIGNIEKGVSNGAGWVLQGFIEARDGSLRPQTLEETTSCAGCHGGIGATTDSTFSFARKLDPSGWFDWSQKDLRGINEPKVEYRNAGVQYEYSFYLMYAGAGDGLRGNDEVTGRFFDSSGRLRAELALQLHEDISVLLYPSAARALALDKAYKTIVEDQSYILGRDPLVTAATNVHREITAELLDTQVSKSVVARGPAAGDLQLCRPHPAGRSVSGKPVSPSIRSTIDGKGMAGPDGERYKIDRAGLIDESSYALETKGVYFPPRHTLPTRMIVPNAAIPSCYECHRLPSAMPPKDPQVKIPVELAASANPEGGLVLKRLTDSDSTDVGGAWSPDGRRIAWVSNQGGSYQIWIMGADGAGKRPLTSGPSVHGWPAWSPDGSRLAYWGYDPDTGRSSISITQVDGQASAAVLVQSEGSLDRPAWRPDGKYLAWAEQLEGNWDIWAAEIGGDRRYRLTHDAQMETNPRWSPDGQIIGYKVAPNKVYNLTIENFILLRDGFESPSFRVWDGVKSIQMSDWSPDGTRIAYTAEAVTGSSGEYRVSYLAVVEEVLASGGRTSGTPVVLSGGLTLGDRGPVFSPQGDRVAFWAWDLAYRATLWVAHADGTGLKQLTTEGNDFYPRWSPDGARLLFESSRAGNLDIWTVAID